MTEGPPPSAASSSKVPSVGQALTPPQSQIPSLVSSPSSAAVSNPNATLQQPYLNYATWGNMWSPTHPGYPPPSTNAATSSGFRHPQQALYTQTSSNPYAAHIFQPHVYNTPQLPKSTYVKPNSNQPAKPPPPTPVPTPPLPDPETFKNWDEVIKKFLVRTKMTQTLKGLENDMLVLSPEWEQKMIPEALKEMVVSLQSILDRITGKKNAEDSMHYDPDVDITTVANKTNEGRSLEERKLDYVHLSPGVEPRTQSSINKSISQFLSYTRARNDASNRAEFLYTLAEKKRKLAEAQAGYKAEDDGQGEKGGTEYQITSCARVNAKPIDRDKQIKYDIAKYGEGPLTRTVKSAAALAPSVNPFAILPNGSALADTSTSSTTLKVLIPNGSDATSQPQRKRKLDAMNGAEDETQVPKIKPKSTRKGKGKAKEDEQTNQARLPKPEPEEDGEEIALSMATAARHPGIDERLKNVEEHLAIRYVPTPPRTLLARLKYLEDHVIKLEKEYPPWAALHFNQPNRGWPPPPRATPIIVPPHLRSVAGSAATPSSTALSHTTSATAGSALTVPSPAVPGQSPGSSTSAKPRKTNSSLHKAVLERLEVQKAMSEMGGKGSRD